MCRSALIRVTNSFVTPLRSDLNRLWREVTSVRSHASATEPLLSRAAMAVEPSRPDQFHHYSNSTTVVLQRSTPSYQLSVAGSGVGPTTHAAAAARVSAAAASESTIPVPLLIHQKQSASVAAAAVESAAASASTFWSDRFSMLNLYPTATPTKASTISGPNCVQKFMKIVQLVRDALTALEAAQLPAASTAASASSQPVANGVHTLHGFDGTVGDAACQIRAALVLDVSRRTRTSRLVGKSDPATTTAASGGNGYHHATASAVDDAGLSQAIAVTNRLLSFLKSIQSSPIAQRKTFNLSEAIAATGLEHHIPVPLAACVMSYILQVGSIRKPWSPLLAPPGSTHLTSNKPPFPNYLTVSDWLPLQQATGPELYGRHFYNHLMTGAKYNLCLWSTRYIQNECQALLQLSSAQRMALSSSADESDSDTTTATTSDSYWNALHQSVSDPSYLRTNHIGMTIPSCYSIFSVLDWSARLKQTPFVIQLSRLHPEQMTELKQLSIPITAAAGGGGSKTPAAAPPAVATPPPAGGRIMLDCCSIADTGSVSDEELISRIRAVGVSPLWRGMSAVHTQFPDSFKPKASAASAPSEGAPTTATAAVTENAEESVFPVGLRGVWRADRDRALKEGMCEPNQSFCHIYHVRAH